MTKAWMLARHFSDRRTFRKRIAASLRSTTREKLIRVVNGGLRFPWGRYAEIRQVLFDELISSHELSVEERVRDIWLLGRIFNPSFGIPVSLVEEFLHSIPEQAIPSVASAQTQMFSIMSPGTLVNEIPGVRSKLIEDVVMGRPEGADVYHVNNWWTHTYGKEQKPVLEHFLERVIEKQDASLARAFLSVPVFHDSIGQTIYFNFLVFSSQYGGFQPGPWEEFLRAKEIPYSPKLNQYLYLEGKLQLLLPSQALLMIRGIYRQQAWDHPAAFAVLDVLRLHADANIAAQANQALEFAKGCREMKNRYSEGYVQYTWMERGCPYFPKAEKEASDASDPKSLAG